MSREVSRDKAASLNSKFIAVSSNEPDAYTDARSSQIAAVSTREILEYQDKYKAFFDIRTFSNTRTVYCGPLFPLRVTWVKEPNSYFQRGFDTSHQDELVTRGYKPLRLDTEIVVKVRRNGKVVEDSVAPLGDMTVFGGDALSLGIPRDKAFANQMWLQHKIAIPPLPPGLENKIGFLYPIIVSHKGFIITDEYRLWGADTELVARFERVVDSGLLIKPSATDSPIAQAAIQALGASPDLGTRETVLVADPSQMDSLQAFSDGTLSEITR